MLGSPKLGQGGSRKTGRPEDEWSDYGDTMDELLAAGDEDSSGDIDLGDGE